MKMQEDKLILAQMREVLKTARDSLVLIHASNAAFVNGIDRLEYLQLLVSRLDEEGMLANLLFFLGSYVIGDGGDLHSAKEVQLDIATARKCKAAWTTFLKEREAALKMGAVFNKDDPALKPEMFPKADPPERE